MKRAIIIPARYNSSRLPGKPLLRATGKYLIQHVYENALRVKSDMVVVATDDQRIRQAVEQFGGNVCMTRSDHISGTDRVAEVASSLDVDLVLNVQGDEPMVDSDHLTHLFELMENAEGAADVATLAVPIQRSEEWLNPNCVKVVRAQDGTALYFSRSPIPYVRDETPSFPNTNFLRHVGLYCYRKSFLLKLAAAPPSPLELLEKLEQLRVYNLAGSIKLGVVDAVSAGVDTPEDYETFVRLYHQGIATRAA